LENLEFLFKFIYFLKFYYPLPIVYIEPPNPWYFDPPAHGISTRPTYGIMNSSLLVEIRGGSIYHEGVQNTMTKNCPRVKIPYGKLNPGSKYHM
jgi:hypothetical protein